ncbi:serine/threonine-protein kinase Nek10-like [Clytia hemisphaerica]|uniref:serine/threonine-protein kinase Nek10-like n=1 Tax=Clytia hemisphaerica TaxID=252671 RepID=UPI0034D4C186
MKYSIYTLVLLLSSTSLVIIHLSTFALIALTKSDEAKIAVSELNVVERLLQIIGEFDSTSKQVASTLLRQLCTVQEIKQQIRIYHGVPTLLSLLRSDAMKLLWNILCILVHLAEDTETSNMVRLLGGIPILVSLLQNRQYSYDDEVFDGSSSVRFKNNDVTNLKSAVCAALTQLILNDTNARHLLQANGIYFVALQIFTKKSKEERNHLKSNELQLQKNAFRTLRFMFSMERNRQLFKRIFPPDLFEIFIDVGHYQQELDAYDKLVQIFNQLPDEEIDIIKENVQAVNHNKEPIYHIQQYAVYEHLGSGAFGSVYKVKKKGGQTFLAMKEISTHNTEFGKSARERNTNANGIINECIFVKKQINHVNIVKYHKAFVEGDKLYIIMDLIDGAPLGEHFNALKEKQQMFSEDRLWNIFIQIVLALRYIHKEKSIVHRDLTPNNIMLGEDYKVTITDFGLARQKNSDASKLTSMVGTIVYSCPEVVRGIEYGEKADIWAIGCILYQMACLEPPFFSSNMLSLATKIVEGEYEELPDGLYDPLVSTVIQRCLTVKAEERPDIIEVASLITDLLISHMEKLRMQTFDLERRLEKEKKRLQRHTDDMKNYHMSYNSGSGKQKYDESFSEQESGATSDNQTDSSLPSSARSRQKSLPSNNIKYEESLTPATDDDGGGCRQFKSKPIKIQQRSDQRREIVSSSGSFEEDTEEDDLFKKPSNLPRRLDPHQNNNNRRKFSQNDIRTEAVVDKMMNHVKRTQSCSYIDNLNALEKTPTKHRPTSAQTTLTISPRRVRVIDDPVLQMLTQLHKIIYITQLPPPMKIDATRRTIDQYKRSLFSAPSSALSLKNELKKLLEGSKEHVDIVSPSLEGSGRFNTSLSNLNEQAIDASVTYEELKVT